jgi:ankyrin repeat protein
MCSEGERAVREALRSHPTDWITVIQAVRAKPSLLRLRQSYRRYTPLHCAAAERKADYVALLLHFGSDPNAKDAFGFTPLATAASADLECVDVVRALLRHKDTDPFPCCGSRGTPLHGAALRGHAAVSQLLIARIEAGSARVLDRLDWRDCTALQVAHENGHGEVATILSHASRAAATPAAPAACRRGRSKGRDA